MTTMVLPKGLRLPPPENITLNNSRIVDISGWSVDKLADTILEYEEYNFAADAADAADAAAAADAAKAAADAVAAAAAKAAADAAKAAADAAAADAAKAAADAVAAADVAERNRILLIVKGKRPIYYKLSGGLTIFIDNAKEGQMTINSTGRLVPARVGPYMTLPKGLRLKAPENLARNRSPELLNTPEFTSGGETGGVVIWSFTDSSGYVTLEKAMVVYIDGLSNEQIVDRLVEYEKHN